MNSNTVFFSKKLITLAIAGTATIAGVCVAQQNPNIKNPNAIVVTATRTEKPLASTLASATVITQDDTGGLR